MKLLGSLAAIVIFGVNLVAQEAPKHGGVLSEFSTAVEQLCTSVSPSVVQIEVHSRVALDNDDSRRAAFFVKQSGTGSGVIVDPAGYIITNAHVVEGSKDIDVSVADASDQNQRDAHKHFPARVVGIDKETDLVVLKIEADHLPALDFLDSDKLKQGQIVFALGSPLGLDNTLTVGYVSATSRQLKQDQAMSYVQTDAPINPGNSGGPLLNIDGKIAGINTMILSQSGGSEGIGFAIPSNMVRRIYEQLRKEGRIHRGTIGVIAQDISPQMEKVFGLNRHAGVIISDVTPKGAAEAADLRTGDIVLSIDGRRMTEARQVKGEILQRAVGDQLKLEILRNDQKMQVTVAVLEQPSTPLPLADLVNSDSNLVKELGILALTLDERVVPSLPELRRLYGVVVAAIPAEYAAINPGLKAGDVIYELNKARVHSLEELRTSLQSLKSGDPVVLLTEHEGTLGYTPFTLE